MSQCFKINKKDDIIYFTARDFEDGVIHGFSTRHGGVSLPPFASLNLGFHTGDDPEAVQENRKRFCNALGIDPEELVNAEQVHGDRVRVVGVADAGAGALSLKGSIPSTDAMITKEKVALMAFFADCVPILIYDPIQKAVGVAHAGWSGTVQQIGAKTVKAMAKEFSTRPQDCLIAIGPSVGHCCYEVDGRVIDRIKETFPYWQDLVEEKDDQHWNLDLWAANRQSLIEVGVLPDNICVSEMCTLCNKDMLFSHRGDKGTTGRLAAVIRLR